VGEGSPNRNRASILTLDGYVCSLIKRVLSDLFWGLINPLKEKYFFQLLEPERQSLQSFSRPASLILAL
jgi:hypothetical protein